MTPAAMSTASSDRCESLYWRRKKRCQRCTLPASSLDRIGAEISGCDPFSSRERRCCTESSSVDVELDDKRKSIQGEEGLSRLDLRVNRSCLCQDTLFIGNINACVDGTLCRLDFGKGFFDHVRCAFCLAANRFYNLDNRHDLVRDWSLLK